MNKSIQLRAFFAISLLFIGYALSAQTYSVEGTITDSSMKRNLPSATISIVQAKDSSLVSFTRTGEDGYFILKNLAKGNYLLSISYVGYQAQWVAFKTGSNSKINLSTIYMEDANKLSTVVVTSRRAPVVINGDSIEFNSENFKTVPNAVVEDMLKKMPGIEVDKAGAITVNGKAVTKVFVNGKEFFGSDPKLATRNLPADAVDKIQVYDRRSDQSMFTGIDDGNEETAINIKTKKDRAQSTFGKVGSGFGSPSRYDAQGNLNKLNNDEQFSLVSSANNTNRQNFSNRDFSSFNGGGGGGRGGGGGGATLSFGGGGGGGANSQGVATTLSGGANYSNIFNQKKTDFNANISASDVETNNTSSSFTQNLTPGNLFNRKSKSNSTSKNQSESFGGLVDHKVSESFSFKYTPSISKQHNSSNSSFADNNTVTYLPNGDTTNSTNTKSNSVTDAMNINNTLLLRKKFTKKGRTISSTLTQGYNQSTSNSSQFTEQLFYNAKVITKDSILDLQNKRVGNTQTYSANVVYTEPLGKTSLLEFNGYINKSIGESSKKVYEKNKASGVYDVLNTRLTNEFNSDYTYFGGGMNYRLNKKKVVFSTGLSLQNARLNGENISAKTKLNQDFKDILPSATFRYNFSTTKNLSLDYRTSTQQPSIAQLQPVLDQSNINNQSIGNPDLKRSYAHNMNLRFFSAKILKQRNFFALLNASTTNNSIVNYDSVLPSRVILSRPVNVNGAYRIFGTINYGFSIRKLNSRFNFGINGGFNNGISYANGLLNNIVTKSAGPSFTYNFQLDEKIDIDLSARYSFSNTSNAINSGLNTNYLTRVYGADITNYLPFEMLFNQSLNYTINSGRAAGFNTSIPIWNASLSKFFLKNKRAELKLSAFDILNKNVGISRNVSQNQIVDQQYNVINQYFLATFTYSLQKSGLNANKGRTMTIRMN